MASTLGRTILFKLYKCLHLLGQPKHLVPELKQYNQWLTQKHSDLSFGPDLTTNQLNEGPGMNSSLSSFSTSEKLGAHSLKLLQALKLLLFFLLLL